MNDNEVSQNEQSDGKRDRRFCPQCGEGVEASARFCAHCGAALAAGDADSPATGTKGERPLESRIALGILMAVVALAALWFAIHGSIGLLSSP